MAVPVEPDPSCGTFTCEVHDRPGNKITEYGQLMSGGGVHVWNLTPELLDIFPLEDRIKAGKIGGGIVVRREIHVVQDWQEVP